MREIGGPHRLAEDERRTTKTERQTHFDGGKITTHPLPLFRLYCTCCTKGIIARNRDRKKKDLAETNGNAMKAQSKGTVWDARTHNNVCPSVRMSVSIRCSYRWRCLILVHFGRILLSARACYNLSCKSIYEPVQCTQQVNVIPLWLEFQIELSGRFVKGMGQLMVE